MLTTRFISQNSILELCDWMPVGSEALPHCIMRLLTATHGDIEVELRCRPAFQYAGVEHTLELSVLPGEGIRPTSLWAAAGNFASRLPSTNYAGKLNQIVPPQTGRNYTIFNVIA